jgi:hypothetical protein
MKDIEFFFHQIKNSPRFSPPEEVFGRMRNGQNFYSQIGRPVLTRGVVYADFYPYTPQGAAFVFALNPDQVKQFLVGEQDGRVFSLIQSTPEELRQEAMGWLEFQKLRNVNLSEIGFLPASTLAGVISYDDLTRRPVNPRLERFNSKLDISQKDIKQLW